MKQNTISYQRASEESPELRVLGMITGVWMSRCIHYAVKKGLFRLIADGTTSTNDLATRTQVEPGRLFRLLKGLEHLELLRETHPRTFELTTLGATLVPGVKGRLAEMSVLWGEEFYRAWGLLESALEQGASGFELAHGESLFEYLPKNKNVATRFGQAMHGIAELLYPELTRLIDWTQFSHVMDVGGGNGFLLYTLIEAHPNLLGTLFDMPNVVESTRRSSTGLEFGERVNYVGGNFFSGVPSGADCIVLSNIIHDWDDEKAVTILRNCRDAVGPKGKIVLVEMVLDHAQEPLLARSTDLNMLILTGGQERTVESFEDLLCRAGLSLHSVINVKNLTCALIAEPVLPFS